MNFDTIHFNDQRLGTCVNTEGICGAVHRDTKQNTHAPVDRGVYFTENVSFATYAHEMLVISDIASVDSVTPVKSFTGRELPYVSRLRM